MVLEAQKQPLVERELNQPEVGDMRCSSPSKLAASVATDLHVYDGDLKHPKLPLVLGHGNSRARQAIGRV